MDKQRDFVLRTIEERGVKFVRLWFTDVLGTLTSVALAPAEVDFPYDDSSSFQDLETGRKIPVVPDKLREQYRELVQDHIQALTDLCSQNRIDYAFLNTKAPLDLALFKYLAKRHKMTKVR